MKQRVLTGVALAAFMILLFFTKTLTPYVFDAFLVFVAVVAGMEMSNLLTKIGYYNNKKVIFAYPILAYGLFKLSTSQSLPLYLVFVLQIALVILLAGVVSLVSLLSKKASDNEIKTRKITCTIFTFQRCSNIIWAFIPRFYHFSVYFYQ